MGGEDFDGANAFNGFSYLGWRVLWWCRDEQVNMVGYDLNFFELPPVCGAGLRNGIAARGFHGPSEDLMAVFSAENDVITNFINLVTISLHLHVSNTIIALCPRGKAGQRNGGSRP